MKEKQAAHMKRERRDSRPIGKVMKELKRRVSLAVDRVRVTIPTSAPWDDNNFMEM